MLDNFEKIYAPVLNGKEDLRKREIQVLCPFHNDKNASMSINTESGLYHCFACNASGSAIGFYMKYNNLTYREALEKLGQNNYNYENKPIKQIISKEKPKRELIDYSNYCYKVCNDTIMHNEFYEFYAKKLYDLRGITFDTAVACLIGYDPSKGWIFPCIDYETEKFVGYEIRHKLFQHFKFKNGNEIKCYKADNTPSCLCWIYKAWNRKKCIVNEGFVDGYFQYQFQHEKAQKYKGEFAQVDCNIITSSCGVKHIPELVEQAKLWNDFDEIIFCLDNDNAGRDAKEKLLALPHENKFRFFNMLEDGEDFEEFYKRVLVKELYK